MSTLGPARPIRALVAVLALWVGGRTAYVLSETAIPFGAPEAKAVPAIVAAGLAGMPTFVPTAAQPAHMDLTQPKGAGITLPSKARRAPLDPALANPIQQPDAIVPFPPAGFIATASVLPVTGATLAPSAPVIAVPAVSAPLRAQSKWSGSIWLAARDGPSAGLASGSSQLGGSQAGLRLYRELSPALSLTGRISTALGARQGEASAGVALRSGAFALLAERRFALDSGGRNDWSVTAVAGVSDVKLPLALRLDGYAQAGVVGRDGFADGALRVERAIMGEGPNRLAVGAGIWAAAQPGVARLDVGPQLVAHVLAADRAVRLSAEWRQRVAGIAAPGSGPVVTFGTDF